MVSERADWNPFVEYFVRFYVFILAAIFAIKELLFEANNQGINQRLNKEIESSPILQLQRKIAVVTGADGTIGIEIVKRLLQLGFTVHTIVKERTSNSQLLELINMYTSERVKILEADFEDPYSVARLAEDFATRGSVQVVVLGAGVMLAPEKYIEDIESHMCVNVVSQALLLEGIKENLTAETRIVALSSTCARAAYKHGYYEHKSLFLRYMGPYQAYAMSKLTLSTYMSQLAKNEKLQVASLHPGVVPGRLYRNVNFVLKFITYMILPFIMRSAKFSAQLVVHTALRSDFVMGAYYEDCEVKDVQNRLSDQQQRTIYDSVKECIRELRE